MRSLCNPMATSDCKGSIIWFNHAIWAMVNKVETFFPNQSNNNIRFAAFMLWLSNSTNIAIKTAIVNIGREHMIEAAIQLSKNPLRNCYLTYKMFRWPPKSRGSWRVWSSPSCTMNLPVRFLRHSKNNSLTSINSHPSMEAKAAEEEEGQVVEASFIAEA